ncbi:MAG: hypothetical protein JOZ52_08395 [Acidobacteria bacterium]|nr:hypothetical protein [Acidobacteriota bacterium]
MAEEQNKAKDIFTRLSLATLGKARERKMSLSAYLEANDPSHQYSDGLDAFQRQLREANIRVASYPEYGVYADPVTVFTDPAAPNREQRLILFHEWFQRQCRAATILGQPYSTRSLYGSGDSAVNTGLRPFADATQTYESLQIAPQIPVSALVATTTPIEGDAYRKTYIENDPTQQRKRRVVEGAEIPGVKLLTSEQTVRTPKFGVKITITSEAQRRLRLSMLSIHIQRMKVQDEMDKVAAIIEVLVNGDGNSGTAATVIPISTLGGTAGTLGATGWLNFKKEFASPYRLTTVLMRKGIATKFEMLDLGTANLLLSVNAGQLNAGDIMPINQSGDGVSYGWLDDAPANKIVAFDKRFAIEQVVENGSNITETMRNIENQTDTLTDTENEGFAKIDVNAVKILDIAN